LPAFVADLIRRQVAVIAATGGTAPAVAAKAATTTIPIVFSGGQDPVKLGLVESLGRPGGNATGALNIATALNSNSEDQIADLEAAAGRLERRIQIFNASAESEFDSSFAAMVRQGAGALYVGPDPFFTSRIAQLVALARQRAMPASYSFRSFAVAGGLMTYGANLPDQHRQVGVYAGRILKGARPTDLPVLQPTKFDLVINLKTAKALGLEVSAKLLALADEVIE
jgi:putative ABC transport system substrate-binding protein